MADRLVSLGWGHVSRDLLRLHIFRHAGEESNRSIAVSYSNPERSGRSGGEPKRDDFDVQSKGRQGNRSLGGRVEIASIRIRHEVTPMKGRSYLLIGVSLA